MKCESGCYGRLNGHGITENSCLLLLISRAPGLWVHRKIAKPVTQLDSRTVHLQVNLPEFAVPPAVGRIVGQRIIRGSIIKAAADCTIDVVAVVKRFAAGALSQVLHAFMRGLEG